MSSQQLRTYLHDAAQKLSEEAVHTPEAISEEQIEQLKRFVQLAEIYENTKPKPKQARWPVITILALVVFIVGFGLLLKIPKTEIELELTLTDVQFTLPKQAALTKLMVLSEVGISDLQDIQLPRARNAKSRSLSFEQNMGAALKLTALEDNAAQGSITLSPMLLPAGTRVSLNITGLMNQYRLVLSFPENAIPNLQISVQGMVKVAISGAPPEENNYPFPQPIQLQPTTNRVIFDLTLPDNTRTTFSSHIPAQYLSFLRSEKIGSYEREISSLLSGALYLTNLNNQEHSLRVGEYLLAKESDGLIRLLALEEDQLSLQFHGKVQGLTTGWQENPKFNNLMPNYLEWLTTQRTVVFLWSTTISVFVFLLGLWRWWRKTE